jgi:hypothetical protein
MIKIAHRGNYKGREENKENTLMHLYAAMRAGYCVEIDVRSIKGTFFLGHDEPQEIVGMEFMARPDVWVHAKNTDAMYELWGNPHVNVFWHEHDDFAITSKGFKWANAHVLTRDGILVMPELDVSFTDQLRAGTLKPLGVCSDNFVYLGL